MITTIILWDFLFDWLGFKSTFVARLLATNPLLLVDDGRIVKKNLEKEFIIEDELMSQLRQQGMEDCSAVKKCYLESNGHFSILTETPDQRKQKGN